MEYVHALKVMQDSFDSMQRSGLLDGPLTVKADTVILGSGSILDSLGFVTFVSDLEERLSSILDRELFLELTLIHEFNSEQSFLSAGVLAKYIEKITAE